MLPFSTIPAVQRITASEIEGILGKHETLRQTQPERVALPDASQLDGKGVAGNAEATCELCDVHLRCSTLGWMHNRFPPVLHEILHAGKHMLRNMQLLALM
jgi:hypothetical protein